MPVVLGLFGFRRATMPTIGGNRSPGLYHRLAIGSFAIGSNGGWMLFAEALFELGHCQESGFVLGRGDYTSYAQTAVDVNGRDTPVFTGIGLGIGPPFWSLWPT